MDVRLYGSGPRTDSLRTLAATLGVEDRIAFPGALAAGEELDAALRQADLFVMPHRTSASAALFRRNGCRSAGAGLPHPASIDTVYEGLDGFLSPLDDVQGLAERTAFLANNRSVLAAASRGARRRALENTRGEWFRLRAQWTLSMMNEGTHAGV